MLMHLLLNIYINTEYIIYFKNIKIKIKYYIYKDFNFLIRMSCLKYLCLFKFLRSYR